MKLLRLSLFLFFILHFISCSNDDDVDETQTTTPENQVADIKISSVTKTKFSDPESDESFEYDTYRAITKSEVIDNKFGSSTTTRYGDDVILSEETNVNFSYNEKGLLTSGNNQFYFYDDSDRLIAVESRTNDNTAVLIYARIKYDSNEIRIEIHNKSHLESDSTIKRMSILTLDENNNITKALLDDRNDGTIDRSNTFIYDDNNNLVQATNLITGVVKNYEYSSVLDTEEFLLNNSFGKLNRTILAGEAISYITILSTSSQFHFEKVPRTNALISTEYTYSDIEESGYYKVSRFDQMINCCDEFHITAEYFFD